MTRRLPCRLTAGLFGGLLAVATTTATAADVDPNAPPGTRVTTLWDTIDTVVSDLDSNPQDNTKRFLVHLAWHEGQQITKRKQNDGGPARSFYQMERAKAIDAVEYAQTKGWLGKLATAAGGGTTEAQLKTALNELKQSPTTPSFPAGNLIGQKLESNDLFGTYMARIALRRIPDAIGIGNQKHAEYWADHWKVKFDSPAQREQLIKEVKKAFDKADEHVPKSKERPEKR